MDEKKKNLRCFWQVQEEASKEVVKAEEPLPENMGNKNFHVKQELPEKLWKSCIIYISHTLDYFV